MRKFISIAAFAVALLIPTLAVAKSHHRHHYQHHHTYSVNPNRASQDCVYDNSGHTICLGAIQRMGEAPRQERTASYSSSEGVVGGRPVGCPHAYCGCSASLRVFGRIIPELNLAANWRKFPPASPAPGMAAWRWGHVFIIEAVNGDGTVIAHDGNSGRGLTRIHTVSLRGYRVVNPNASRYASRS